MTLQHTVIVAPFTASAMCQATSPSIKLDQVWLLLAATMYTAGHTVMQMHCTQAFVTSETQQVLSFKIQCCQLKSLAKQGNAQPD